MTKNKDILIAAAIGIIVLIAGCFRLVPGVCGTFHDDGIYVATAKALAEGQGYRLINLPGAPLQTKYPILYPALLALVWKVMPNFPQNLVAMQILSLLLTAGTAFLSYLYLVRFKYFSNGIALSAALLAGTNTLLLYLGTQTLSDMPFAFMLICVMWVMEKQESNSSKKAKHGILFYLFLGALLALPALMRSAGLVILPVALWFFRSHKAALKWLVTGYGVIMLPWALWTLQLLIHPNKNPIISYYTNYGDWWFRYGVDHIIPIATTNLLAIVLDAAALPLDGLNYWCSVLTGGISIPLFILLGFYTWIYIFKSLRKQRLLPIVLVAVSLVSVMWPWSPTRFQIPILIPTTAYFLEALYGPLCRLFTKTSRLYIATVFVIVGLMFNCSLIYCHHIINITTHYPLVSLYQKPSNWMAWQRTIAWLKQNTHSNDRVAAGLDSLVFLYSGNLAFRPFAAEPTSLFYGSSKPALGTTDQLLRTLESSQTKYLVDTPMTAFSEEKPFLKLINELTKQHPDKLKVVYVDQDRRFIIYQLSTVN